MTHFEKNINKFKEKLSVAYLQAICAKNGVIFEVREYDNDGVDGYLIVYDDNNKREIDIQLKSTEINNESDKHFKYSIKAKNHNDLCNKKYKPNLLLVLLLNKEVGEWVKLTEEEMLVRHFMYYHDYIDETNTSNEHNKTIDIPRSNIVDPTDFHDVLVEIHKNWENTLYNGGVVND